MADAIITGTRYQETHRRCPPNIVAVEYRLGEKCGRWYNLTSINQTC